MQISLGRSISRLAVTLLLMVSTVLVFRLSHIIAAWSLNQGVNELEKASQNAFYQGDSTIGESFNCDFMLSELQGSVKLQPSVDVGRYLLAKAYYECQESVKATESALHWLQIQPETDPLYDPVSRILVGSYLASSDKTGFETLLRGSFHATVGLLDQGDEYLNRGDLAEAQELFALGIRISHSPSSFYLRLGEVYQRRRNFEESLRNYQKALELDAFHSRKDKSRTHTKHGEILFWTGRDIARSIEEFDAAINVQPSNYSAHLLKGIAIYSYENDMQAAQEQIESAIAIDPSRAEAYMTLGDLYYDAGQEDAAEQAYLQVLERDPRNNEALEILESLQ